MLSLWQIEGLLDRDTTELITCRGLRRAEGFLPEDREAAVREAEHIIRKRRSQRWQQPDRHGT